MLLPLAQVLQGRYQLERVLGQGGMGAVYLAQELRLNKRVAIKQMLVPTQDPAERTRCLAQFAREARILADLDHPGLVNVSDFFEELGSQFLVMDYIAGDTLESRLNNATEFLPVAETLGWVEQVCDVLQYLHTHTPPVIFRDLKPANIMLDARGRIRLIDFGIARVFAPDVKTATLIHGAGTPGFSPIEQHGSGSTDARSDIYALGATWYCLLTRTLPPVAVDLITGDEKLPFPTVVNPAIPPAVEAIILRMMALRKEDRFQSITDLRAALRTLVLSAASPTQAAPVVHHFCEACGSAIPPGARVCVSCEHPVGGSHDTVVPPATVSNETVPKPATAPRWGQSADWGIKTEAASASVSAPAQVPVLPSTPRRTRRPWVYLLIVLGIGLLARGPALLNTTPTPTPVPRDLKAPVTPVPVETTPVEDTATPVDEAAQVVREYLTDLQNRDWSGAMALSSEARRSHMDMTRLAKLYENNQGLQIHELTPAVVSGDAAVVHASVDFQDREDNDQVTHKRYPMDFSLVLEDDVWKLKDVQTGEGEVLP